MKFIFKYKKYSLTHRRLLSVLYYDKETGNFTWVKNLGARAKIGCIAGTLSKIHGYINIQLDRKLYKAHRLAWFYVTGKWPENEIDHIDLDKANNKWKNLRASTHSQNMCNKSKQKNNTSGHKGVYYYKDQNKYSSCVIIGKKRMYLGLFDTAKEASIAYAEAAKKYHIEFANTG